jgi:hypothetical protein
MISFIRLTWVEARGRLIQASLFWLFVATCNKQAAIIKFYIQAVPASDRRQIQ